MISEGQPGKDAGRCWDDICPLSSAFMCRNTSPYSKCLSMHAYTLACTTQAKCVCVCVCARLCVMLYIALCSCSEAAIRYLYAAHEYGWGARWDWCLSSKRGWKENVLPSLRDPVRASHTAGDGRKTEIRQSVGGSTQMVKCNKMWFGWLRQTISFMDFWI